MSEVDDESEEVSAGAASRRRAAGSRRMSQSSRMRALEIEKKQSHVVWTGFLLAVIMFAQSFMHIPEAVTGLVGVALIMLSLRSSLAHNRKHLCG